MSSSQQSDCLKCNGGTAAVHSNECWQRIKDENTALRVIAQKVQCVYGMKKDGHCQLGYPGCACADDIVVFDMERGQKVGEVLQKIRRSAAYLQTFPLAMMPFWTIMHADMKKVVESAMEKVKSIVDDIDSLSSGKKQG